MLKIMKFLSLEMSITNYSRTPLLRSRNLRFPAICHTFLRSLRFPCVHNALFTLILRFWHLKFPAIYILIAFTEGTLLT
jgi:hypothetical protein